MGEGQGRKPYPRRGWAWISIFQLRPVLGSGDWFFTSSRGQGRENPPLLSDSVFSKDHLLVFMNG